MENDLVKNKFNDYNLMLFSLVLFLIFNSGLLNIHGTTLIIAVIFSCAFIFESVRRNGNTSIKYSILVYFVFCFVVLFTSIWSDAPEYGFNKFQRLFTLIIPLYFLLGVKPVKSEEYLRLNILIFTVFVLSLSIQVGGLSFLRNMNAFTRLGGEFTNPIIIARYCCFLILTFLFFFPSRKKIFSRLIVSFIICFLFILVILSGSKGPILALVIAIIAAVKFIYILPMVVGGGLLELFKDDIISLLPTHIEMFLSRRFFENTGSLSTRMEKINLALNNLDEHIFIGNGIGDYAYLELGVDSIMYPHNLFVEVLYETGLIFLLFLVMFIVYISFLYVRNFKRTKRDEKYWFSLFVFFLMGGMTTGDFPANAWFLIIGIKLISDLRRISYEKKRISFT